MSSWEEEKKIVVVVSFFWWEKKESSTQNQAIEKEKKKGNFLLPVRNPFLLMLLFVYSREVVPPVPIFSLKSYLERISETSWMGTIARGKFPPCPPPPPPNALLLFVLLLMLCVCASPPRFSVLMMSNSPRYVYINHHHDRWWWIIRVREEETILRRNFKVVAVSQTNERTNNKRSFLNMCVCVCEENEKLIVPRKTRVCSRTLSDCLEFSHRASKTRRCFFLKNSALDIFRLNFLPAKGASCTFFLSSSFELLQKLLLFSADLSTRTRERKKTKKWLRSSSGGSLYSSSSAPG